MCQLSSALPSGPTTKRPQLATFAVPQAHDTPSTWHKQAPSSKHMACRMSPRGEARYPHSAEYWQAGDMVMLRPCDRICRMCVQVKISAPSHVFSRRRTMEFHGVSVQRPDRIGVQCRTIDIVIPRQGSIGQRNRTFRHIFVEQKLGHTFPGGPGAQND